MIGTKLSASELQLGDFVQIDALSGFGGCAVVGVSANAVRLFRPYVQLADCKTASSSNGEEWEKVIEYIGTEEWDEFRACTHKRFTLISRRELR